ncbi:MAG: LamG domain-containing protein [Planctomycetota bacterium]
MYKTFMFLASFIVVLTLVGSVATGKIVFLDDFEDGSATDGAPVTWSPVPGLTGNFEVIDGDFVLTRPSNIEEMFSVVNQYILADTSIRTQARLIGSNAWWFGLFARGAEGTIYIALLKNNTKLEIWRFGSSTRTLASVNVGIDPRAQDVLLRFDVIGNELSAWAWREGEPMPAEPQVRAVHTQIATAGTVGVAADLGTRLSNNDAIFRYVEVYEAVPLSLDFNGDGKINIDDLIILIEHWGQDNPMCDIAPAPFGDGVVNATDLELLMSYWGQPVDDPMLIAHWALDETEGDIAQDSAGTNDAVTFGGPLWQPTGGMTDGAIQLDGVDDCVIIGSVPNPTKGPFSILAWVKGGAPGQVVLSQIGGADWLGTDPAEGNLMTELKAPGRSGNPLQSQINITDGQWHRIGLVWDGSHRTLYVDGIVVAEDTQDGLESSDNGLYIGCGKAMEAGTYFSGLIDDVRIYNRVVIP